MFDAVVLAEYRELCPELRSSVGSDASWPAILCEPARELARYRCRIGLLQPLCPCVARISVYQHDPPFPDRIKEICPDMCLKGSADSEGGLMCAVGRAWAGLSSRHAVQLSTACLIVFFMPGQKYNCTAVFYVFLMSCVALS